MWSKIIAMLIAITLLSGCISEKSENKQETYKTEEALGSYIISLNTTVPVETDVNSTSDCITITSQKKNYLSICLFDIGLGNETTISLEKVIRSMVSFYSWHKSGIWYQNLPKTEINGHQGIIVTGYPKYEPEEVLAAYYPLPGVMMVLHSSFTKQETSDILNTTTITRSEVRT